MLTGPVGHERLIPIAFFATKTEIAMRNRKRHPILQRLKKICHTHRVDASADRQKQHRSISRKGRPFVDQPLQFFYCCRKIPLHKLLIYQPKSK